MPAMINDSFYTDLKLAIGYISKILNENDLSDLDALDGCIKNLKLHLEIAEAADESSVFAKEVLRLDDAVRIFKLQQRQLIFDPKIARETRVPLNDDINKLKIAVDQHIQKQQLKHSNKPSKL